MSWDKRNLCNTLPALPQYETLRCSVGSAPSAWSAYLDWNWYHSWPGGDRKNGRCLNCGKTLAEVRVRINPKTGELARHIKKTETVGTSLAALWAAVESGN